MMRVLIAIESPLIFDGRVPQSGVPKPPCKQNGFDYSMVLICLWLSPQATRPSDAFEI
jgi:hypothetical protein